MVLGSEPYDVKGQQVAFYGSPPFFRCFNTTSSLLSPLSLVLESSREPRWVKNPLYNLSLPQCLTVLVTLIKDSDKSHLGARGSRSSFTMLGKSWHRTYGSWSCCVYCQGVKQWILLLSSPLMQSRIAVWIMIPPPVDGSSHLACPQGSLS